MQALNKRKSNTGSTNCSNNKLRTRGKINHVQIQFQTKKINPTKILGKEVEEKSEKNITVTQKKKIGGNGITSRRKPSRYHPSQRFSDFNILAINLIHVMVKKRKTT